MKFLTFLLSTYIFALNLVPCEDFGALDTDVTTQISQSMDNNHQHPASDLCSPFCICQCCHVSVTYSQFPILKMEINTISTPDFIYSNGFTKDFTSSILQPPKV